MQIEYKYKTWLSEPFLSWWILYNSFYKVMKKKLIWFPFYQSLANFAFDDLDNSWKYTSCRLSCVEILKKKVAKEVCSTGHYLFTSCRNYSRYKVCQTWFKTRVGRSLGGMGPGFLEETRTLCLLGTFFLPRCLPVWTWGPIWRPSEDWQCCQSCEDLMQTQWKPSWRPCWCDSDWWRYQLNSNWICQYSKQYDNASGHISYKCN